LEGEGVEGKGVRIRSRGKRRMRLKRRVLGKKEIATSEIVIEVAWNLLLRGKEGTEVSRLAFKTKGKR